MIKKAIRIIAGVVALGLVGGTVFYLYEQSKPVQEMAASVMLSKRTIVNKTVATGTVVPDNETTIRPRVSGIVQEIYVEPGDKIKAGDPIAKIRVVPNMAQLNAAESQVEQANIELKDAKRNLDRQKELFDKGVVALAELEQMQIANEKAEQSLISAKSNLQIIREGASKSGTTNTIVTSTIDGMVLSVPVEKGFTVIESNTFNEGTEIAEIADMHKMIFEGRVDETEVGKIKVGMPIRLTIGALDDVTFDAVLRYIAPKGIKENGAVLFEIEADVKLQDGLFVRAGYSASADIVLASADSVLAVEERNILFEEEKTFVEVQKDSLLFEKVPVELGLSDGIYAELKTPLSPDARVKVQKQ